MGLQGVGGQSAQDLPIVGGVRGARRGELAGEDRETGAVRARPGRAAEAIKQYVDAGFDEVYISQMGPDQEGGIAFLAEEVLPLVTQHEAAEHDHG